MRQQIQSLPVLYARSNTGKVLEWQMEILPGGKYRTISGQQDGQKVTTETTQAKGKNIGKVNETSPEEQAIAEVEAKYKKQQEQGGYWPEISQIDGNKFFQPQLAHKWEQYGDKADWSRGVYVSSKLDGLRCIITKKGCFSRNGKEFVAFPHIYRKFAALFAANPNYIFDGEIYTHEFKSDFNKIISLAKKSKPTSEDLLESEKYLQYWVFDIPSVPGGYHERYKEMQKIFAQNFKGDKSIILCEHKLVKSEDELKAAFNDYILNGFEGLMANSYEGEYEQKRSKNILKYKEFIDGEFEILDIIEGDGNRGGMFGRALLKIGEKTFFSNARGDENHYRELLKNKDEIIGKMATVRYQNLSPDGIPRFPVIISVRNYE